MPGRILTLRGYHCRKYLGKDLRCGYMGTLVNMTTRMFQQGVSYLLASLASADWQTFWAELPTDVSQQTLLAHANHRSEPVRSRATDGSAKSSLRSCLVNERYSCVLEPHVAVTECCER